MTEKWFNKDEAFFLIGVGILLGFIGSVPIIRNQITMSGTISDYSFLIFIIGYGVFGLSLSIISKWSYNKIKAQPEFKKLVKWVNEE